MSWFGGARQQPRQGAKGPNSTAPEQTEPIRQLQVRWGRQNLQINLPSQEKAATLADLKDELSRVTSVPHGQMQLVSGGALMKDERAPLSRYNLKDGGRVTLVGKPSASQQDQQTPRQQQHGGRRPPRRNNKPKKGQAQFARAPVQDTPRPTPEFEAQQAAAAARKAAESDQSEEGITRRIQSAQHVAEVELLPDMAQLERSVEALQAQGLEASASFQEVAPAAINSTGPNENTTGLLNVHQIVFQQKKLSELLLRQLLSLDNVQVTTDEMRKARRTAVKHVQGMLDRVDDAWTRAKSLGVKPNM